MEICEMNLHQKLLKIANMAGVLQRTKSGYGYKYVPEEDIQAKVTAGLQKYGVMLYTSISPGTMNVTPVHYEKYDAKLKANKPVNEVIVSADMVYTWVNTHNPDERIETSWAFVGQMEDAAQAMGAGLTYGNRYYLLKQLQLATTESDPDNYRSKQKQAEEDEENAERAALRDAIGKVRDAGTALIKKGVDSEVIRATVARHNGGDTNPSSITDMSVCDAILNDFEKLKK